MGPSWVAEAAFGVKADVPPASIVYARALGANVVDVDGNRYVDLAGGFGALLVGHGHPSILRVVALASERLLQALGDVHPSDAKIALTERLSAMFPTPGARVILAQSGADAVTAALKTAVLTTGRPGVIAFRGGYHGLSYAPLAACGLRDGYREPFVGQLGAHVTFVDYPSAQDDAARTLSDVEAALLRGGIGAILIEPILGRGGCVVPPLGFLGELWHLAQEKGALFIADEIWTGLGRAGSLLACEPEGVVPDLVCLGKGLGGGLPMSACVGSDAVMRSWRREPEVVHTSTFAGAPLACATAIATLDILSREGLAARSAEVGRRFIAGIRAALASVPGVAEVRGAGLMVGVDLGPRPGSASRAARSLLERGYIVSTGGGSREIIVLTPPLNTAEPLLFGFIAALAESLQSLGA